MRFRCCVFLVSASPLWGQAGPPFGARRVFVLCVALCSSSVFLLFLFFPPLPAKGQAANEGQQPHDDEQQRAEAMAALVVANSTLLHINAMLEQRVSTLEAAAAAPALWVGGGVGRDFCGHFRLQALVFCFCFPFVGSSWPALRGEACVCALCCALLVVRVFGLVFFFPAAGI